MKHTFYGGIHPAEHKETTARKPVAPLSKAPSQVVIPLSMQPDSPCRLIVKVGETVAAGQQIGQADGPGAPIHASVSGKVAAVEPRPYAGGGSRMSVVIENDFQDTLSPGCTPRSNWEALTPQELVDIIKSAGITGMGGAGVPTHHKLSAALGKADTLILNGAECEPYITADHRLMLEQGEKVLGGARILMRVLGLDKATIGVEGNKLDAVEHLKNLLPTGETGICIRTLRTRYPQGGEKQLIQRITGRKVPPGGVSADVGCCVFNAGTAAAVYNAVVLGLPLTHRIVTVTGDAIARPKNLMVPLGTSFSHLIEEAGGFVMDPAQVISGGPMMGTAQHDLSVTTDKTTNAVLCLAAGDLPAPQREQVCLRCGRCVGVCPMRLAPLYIHMYAQRQLWRRVEDLHAMDCMECGCCQYICPAHIPLVQSLRTSKLEIAHRKGAEA